MPEQTPDVYLIPAGSLWPRATAAIRAASPDDPRGKWRCANGAWLTSEEVARHGHPLILADLVLELADRLDALAGTTPSTAEETPADCYRRAADAVRDVVTGRRAPEQIVRKTGVGGG